MSFFSSARGLLHAAAMPTAPFTKVQPKDGETVLHCGHLDAAGEHGVHFWKYDPPVGFVRPNATTGLATWLCACGPCVATALGNPDVIAIRGDGRWQGDAPVIRGEGAS